jgi:hypothetical protein
VHLVDCRCNGRGQVVQRQPGDAWHSRDSAVGGPSVWFNQPYTYGRIVCMKKTFNVDDKLFKEAKVASGAATDTETVRLGLEALVRHAAYQRLRALRGAEPDARDVPRRRDRPAPKRRVA